MDKVCCVISCTYFSDDVLRVFSCGSVLLFQQASLLQEIAGGEKGELCIACG